MAENEKAAEVENTAEVETKPETEKKRAYVKIFIRKPADERGVKAKVVGINGKMYTVPYDKEVEVPEEVAEVLTRAEAAMEESEKLIESIAQ